MLVGVAASAFALDSASVCSPGFGQGAKPVLPLAAVGTDAPPPGDYGPVSEQRRLYIDPVKAGEVAGTVRSFHVNG